MLIYFFPNSNIYCFNIVERFVNNIKNYSERIFSYKYDCGNEKELIDLIKKLNVKIRYYHR